MLKSHNLLFRNMQNSAKCHPGQMSPATITASECNGHTDINFSANHLRTEHFCPSANHTPVHTHTRLTALFPGLPGELVPER